MGRYIFLNSTVPSGRRFSFYFQLLYVYLIIKPPSHKLHSELAGIFCRCFLLLSPINDKNQKIECIYKKYRKTLSNMELVCICKNETFLLSFIKIPLYALEGLRIMKYISKFTWHSNVVKIYKINTSIVKWFSKKQNKRFFRNMRRTNLS